MNKKVFLLQPLPMIAAMILSGFLVIGYKLFALPFSATGPFLLVRPLATLIALLGIGVLIWILIGILFWFTGRYGIKESEPLKNPFARISLTRDSWLFFFILLVLCYLPYYLAFFPGILTNDSTSQWAQAMGQQSLGNSHPLLHTLLMRLCLLIAGIFGGGGMAAVALFSAAQLLAMAAVYATVLRFLLQFGLPRWAIILAALYYGINPLHGYYSVTHWKDIPFALLMILLALQMVVLVRSGRQHRFTGRQMLALGLTLAASAFFRNNVIYFVAVFIPVLIIYFKKSRPALVVVLLSVMAFCLIVQGPVYRMFRIEKAPLAEALSIPLQQVGRMVATDVPLTQEQVEKIEKVIPLADLKSSYKNFTVNPIKFNENFHGEVLEAQKGEYLALWAELVLEHPVVAAEAFLSINSGFWYLKLSNWSVYTTIYENNLGLEPRPLVPGLRQLLVRLDPHELFTSKRPFLFLVFGVGMMFWYVFLAVLMIFLRRNYRDALIFLPFVLLWGTLLLATPVFCETRYVYSLFGLMPISVAFIFLRHNTGIVPR